MYRLTVRATQDTIPGILLNMMQERLARSP